MSLSLAAQFADEMLEHATERELSALAYDWEFWSRPEQRSPVGVWRVWLILAGRGWGKTRTGAETIREAVENGCMRIALVGATAADVRDVMVLGESGILNVFPEEIRPKYEPSKRRVVFHTGAIATLYSAEQPDRLRGPQHELAWLDELAAWSRLDDTLSNLMMGLRLGKNPRVVITTTPRPLDVLRSWVEESLGDPGVVVTRGRTFDNAGNLPEQFLLDVKRAYGGTRLGRQELEGEILEAVGGLFAKEWIKHIDEPPAKMSRVVVALDPAITARNDETGIVVVGRSGEKAYVLEDLSGTFTPVEWASKAVAAAKKWGAHSIVAEVNRGGDLVKATIRQFDKNILIKEVRAYKGKETRAEPVAALYEQGRAAHVGDFKKLEKQMTEWAPTSPEAMKIARQASSPDRLDALVWGVLELGFHLVGVPRLVKLERAPSMATEEDE